MKPTFIQKRNILIYFLFICLFLWMLNILTPFIFRLLPNDYSRTRLILNTLHDESRAPEIVVFGNSRAMSGVDGYELRRNLKGNPEIFSFTSTGQKISESLLYYTSLPSSVKCVIQCIDVDQLADPINIDVPNRVALHMYGYKMDEVTQRLLPSLYEEMNYSDFIYNYEAKNCLFIGLSSVLRNLLDDDVVTDATNKELYYPNSKTSDRNDIIYKRSINEQNKEKRLASFQVTDEWKLLIYEVYQILNEKNIQYYWVIMPYNPDIKSILPEEKEHAKQILMREFSYIPMIDCMNLLDAADFYDAIHPNRKGAKKITDQIVLRLYDF